MPRSDEGFQWAFGGLAALLVLAPWARGGHPSWAALFLSWAFILLAAGGVILALSRARLSWVAAPEDVWIFGGLSWAGLELVRSASPPEAANLLLILGAAVLCFLLTRRIALAGGGFPLVLVLSLTGGAVVLLGVLQVLDLFPHGWWNPPQWMASTFVNHNHFSAYIEILFPPALLLAFSGSLKRRQRSLLIFSAVLMGAGLAAGGSRGGWLSLLFGAFSACVFARFKDGSVITKARLALWALPLLAGIFLMAQPALLSRWLTLLDASQDASFRMRISMWQGTWTLVEDNPWWGHGLGSFAYLFTRHRPAGLYRFINYAHNEYLQLAAELGIVGLIFLGGAVTGVFRRAVHLRASESPWKRAFGLAGLWGMGSLLVHSFFDFPWHIPAILFTAAAAAGLVTGIPYQANPCPLAVFEIELPRTPTLNFARGALIAALAFTVLALGRPVSALIAADVWAGQGRWEQAIRLAPDRAVYYQRRAEALEELVRTTAGRARGPYLKEIVKVCQKGLELTPHHAPSAHRLGEALRSLVDLQTAEQWFSRALELDPKNPLYWKHWAELELVLKKPEEAVKGFQQAAMLARPFNFHNEIFGDLDRSERFLREGKAALLRGQWEYAESAFQVAARLEPDSEAAAVGLSAVALKIKNLDESKNRMTNVTSPVQRAEWYAALAQHSLSQRRGTEAYSALETALKLDPANILANHLQWMERRRHPNVSSSSSAMDELLRMNRGSVSVRWNASNKPLVVWEPAKGSYKTGHKVRGGWSLFTYGSIEQALVLPPGRVHFEIISSGTSAAGKGPTLLVSWQGRPLVETEVREGSEKVYHIETEVLPGESLLTVRFPDDLRDPKGREDRNLRLHKVTATPVVP